MAKIKKTGIYKIVNSVTNDCYIGSALHIPERWWRHKKDLRKSKQHHSVILQRAWDKYGESNFNFEVIELCNPDALCDRENYWLQLERPVYNICPQAYSQFGRKLSAEHVAKLRAYGLSSNSGERLKKYSKEMCKKVIKLNYITLEEIETYNSLTEAAESVNKSNQFVSTISSACTGKRKSAFGYKWKFKQ